MTHQRFWHKNSPLVWLRVDRWPRSVSHGFVTVNHAIITGYDLVNSRHVMNENINFHTQCQNANLKTPNLWCQSVRMWFWLQVDVWCNKKRLLLFGNKNNTPIEENQSLLSYGIIGENMLNSCENKFCYVAFLMPMSIFQVSLRRLGSD